MHFELKSISEKSIPEALAKVERYRLLNEPGLAESICLDILAIVPDHPTRAVVEEGSGPLRPVSGRKPQGQGRRSTRTQRPEGLTPWPDPTRVPLFFPGAPAGRWTLSRGDCYETGCRFLRRFLR